MNQNQDPHKEPSSPENQKENNSLTSQVLDEWNTLSRQEEKGNEPSVTQMIQDRMVTGKKPMQKKYGEKTPYSNAFLAKIGHFVEAPPTPIERSPLEATPVVKDPEEQLPESEDPWQNSVQGEEVGESELTSEESIISQGLQQVSEGTWQVRDTDETAAEEVHVSAESQMHPFEEEQREPTLEAAPDVEEAAPVQEVQTVETAPLVQRETVEEESLKVVTPIPAPPIPSTPAVPPPTSQPMEIWEPWGNLVATSGAEDASQEKTVQHHQPPILSAGSLPPLPKVEVSMQAEFPLPTHSGRSVRPPQKTKTTPMVTPEEPSIAMTLLSPDDPLLTTPPSLAEKSGDVEEIHTHLEGLSKKEEEKMSLQPKEVIHSDPLAMPPSLADGPRYQEVVEKTTGEESLVMELQSLDLWNQSEDEKKKKRNQSKPITSETLKKFAKEMTRGEGNSVLDEVEREEEEREKQALKEEESKKKEARFKEQLTWEMEDLFAPAQEPEDSEELMEEEEDGFFDLEEEEEDEIPEEEPPMVLTPEAVFETEEESEEIFNDFEEDEDEAYTRVYQNLGENSLIQMKNPHIIIEKPLSMKAEDEAKAAERARKEQEKQTKEKSPLISLQEPNFAMGKGGDPSASQENEEENLYDSIFDLENLPSPDYPPVQKERPKSEEDEIPFDPEDPLYELIEALREPLPTERFSNELKGTGEQDPFASLLDQLSTPHLAEESSFSSEEEGPSQVLSEIRADLKAKSSPTPEAPPSETESKPRRTPYEDKSPWDLATGWLQELLRTVLPKDSLPNQDKQVRLITNMLVIACSLGFMFMLVLSLMGDDAPNIASSSTISVVQIDVNPSIRLSVDGKNKVTQVDALNTEARALLDKSTLEDKPLEEVITSVTELLFYHGYLQDSSAILATVEDVTQTRGEELSMQVKDELDQALWTLGSSTDTVGLWVDPEYNYSTKAIEYEVSLGKMVIMQQLFQAQPYFSLANLAEYSQNELYQMYVSGTKMLPIGIDSAVELARQSALLSTTDSYSTKVTVSLSAVTPNYTVVFQTPTKEFFVQVDGYEGNILFSQELASTGIADDQNILPSEAKSIALQSVSVLEISSEDLHVAQDWSKGRLNYVVSFRSRDVEYKITVFGMTGEVIDQQMDKIDVSSVTDVGQSRIQEIAFEDAGVTKSQLGGVTMDRYMEEDMMIYTLEFWSGSRQYSYEMAGDGTIRLSSFADYGDETTILNPMLMSETAAKDIALSHVGVNFSQIHSLTVGINEYQNYEIEFLVDQTPYYYLVSGVTGEIYWYEKREEEVTTTSEPVEEEIIYDIGEEGAKQIALSEANLKDVMIQSFIITEDGEGKDKSYTVIFNFMNIGYYYEISADSGAVLDRKQDFQQIQSTATQTAPPTQEELYQEMLDSITNFNTSMPSLGDTILAIPSY